MDQNLNNGIENYACYVCYTRFANAGLNLLGKGYSPSGDPSLLNWNQIDDEPPLMKVGSLLWPPESLLGGSVF